MKKVKCECNMNEVELPKSRKKHKILGFLFLYLAVTLIYSILWLIIEFPSLDLATIIFQLKVPLDGTEMSSFTGVIVLDTVGSMLTTIVISLLCLFVSNKMNKKNPEKAKCRTKLYFRVTLICFLVSFIGLLIKFRTFSYLYHQIVKTTLYEDYYVDPETAEVTFPEEKRNLVYIYLESMEVSYTDRSSGGISSENYMPKLTELSKDNTNFSKSGSEKLNGVTATTGTTWTMASFVAQTSGIPLTIPIARNAMGNGYATFLPGAYGIGNILEKEGYNQTIIFGSTKSFSGFDVYLTSHGNYRIFDYDYANENALLPYEDYFVWWGYEDQRLFQFAKEEALSLAADEEPFALTLMTIDTHRTGGYVCDLCEDRFDNQYANVIGCSDNQVTEFIQWLQEQSFYDNTTIVLVGDHPTMDEEYVKGLPGYKKDYERLQYVCVLNSAVDYTLDQTREYTCMDMYPTTLAAMGVKISGDRLGLGTNLYSETPTLLEELGIKKLNSELNKKSIYYNENLLY